MLRSIVFVVALGVNSATSAQPATPEQPRWLCVADATTGFSFDTEAKRWRVTSFRSESKWVLRPADASEKAKLRNAKWLAVPLGGERSGRFCFDDFRDDELICNIFGGRITFDRKTLRYIMTQDIGYTSHIETEGSDTPYMEIGRCFAF